MHFIKYFAIFVLLAVQYSFQDTSSSGSSISSSEENELDFAESQEMPLPKDFVITNDAKPKQSLTKRLFNKVKKQTERATNSFKSKFTKDHFKKGLKKTKDKLSGTLKKGKKNIGKAFGKMTEGFNKLLKKKSSGRSDLDENETRLKRSFFGKTVKKLKTVASKGTKKTKKLLEKLF
uniref:Uncharacterized protein n=1 Tax=Strongyloides venezuelensis TaxID=75913 RepID=A0A0K0F1L4_STRVS